MLTTLAPISSSQPKLGRGPKEVRPAEGREFGSPKASPASSWYSPTSLEGLQTIRHVKSALLAAQTDNPTLCTLRVIWAQGVGNYLEGQERHFM